jgi:hypothetical protein
VIEEPARCVERSTLGMEDITATGADRERKEGREEKETKRE